MFKRNLLFYVWRKLLLDLFARQYGLYNGTALFPFTPNVFYNIQFSFTLCLYQRTKHYFKLTHKKTLYFLKAIFICHTFEKKARTEVMLDKYSHVEICYILNSWVLSKIVGNFSRKKKSDRITIFQWAWRVGDIRFFR